MYLMKRLCDLTLGEVAREFGVKSYGTVGWACHGIRLKCAVNSKFRRQIENLWMARRWRAIVVFTVFHP